MVSTLIRVRVRVRKGYLKGRRVTLEVVSTLIRVRVRVRKGYLKGRRVTLEVVSTLNTYSSDLQPRQQGHYGTCHMR